MFGKISLKCIFSSFNKGLSDEDSFVELYCEEVDDPTSTPSCDCNADCQQTGAGDTGQFFTL